MLIRRSLPLLLLLGGLFALGIGRLFILRFEAGDIYPAYSTLRADPLGTKALFGALQEMEGLEVTRNNRSLHQLPREGQPVFFYLGMPRRYFDFEKDLEELDGRVRAGARLIVSLKPETAAFDREKEEAEAEKEEKTKPSRKEKYEPIRRSELWKVEFVSLKKLQAALPTQAGLEGEISGHSFVAFAPGNSSWRTLYAVDGQPVIIERPYGLGSLVLCADSWIFSNEALRLERRPELLARLVGPGRNVIFDETHHGIHEQPGVATLARRYRLHGAFAICLLLGILFVWRNASPLVPFPSQREDSAGEIVTGHDAAAGLTNLLRRSISPKDLAALCLAQWRQAPPHPVTAATLETATALADDSAKTPLERYRALCQYLTIHAKRP